MFILHTRLLGIVYNRVMAYERVQRLLRMVTVLQQDESPTAESLMKELGVSRRTLFRDLSTLKEAGIPYHYDRKHGYQLDADFHLPPVNLTIPETMGLMLLSKFAMSQRHRPMISSALSAIYKIMATVPKPIHDVCKEMMANVSIARDAQPIGNQDFDRYILLQRCIDERRSCRVVYRSPIEEQAIHMVFDPYLLHNVNRAWYAFGYSDVHDQVRMLKLCRLVEIGPTDEHFQRPESFKAEDKLDAAWRMIPEGKEYDIVLEFSAKVAINVSEVKWHASQQHEMLEDGRCLMRLRVDGINEIAWWVCGYADQVTVVKPPELRDKVEQMHRAALKRHEAPALPPVVDVRPGIQPVKTKRTDSPS